MVQILQAVAPYRLANALSVAAQRKATAAQSGGKRVRGFVGLRPLRGPARKPRD